MVGGRAQADSFVGKLGNSRMIERPVPTFQVDVLHPYLRKVLGAKFVILMQARILVQGLQGRFDL
jgi:hypothetical protein